ncbi:hypothetical protein DFQ28_002886 [Apophysomyces sp. BC1034]|nr:hypothetical protein DFQ30_002981 [Apophysomyces sp. BC1015]KAG0180139.1 hypothetical protein DFQ29_001201 [Apophysomyces sp. BC1021]KAG0189786.1 hypothetical protein DFQ28_002886 [Apophysomyces sp. BC1034]
MEEHKRVVFDEETWELARFFSTTGPARKPQTDDILGRMTRILRRRRQPPLPARKKYIMLPTYNPPSAEDEMFSSFSLQFPALPPSPTNKDHDSDSPSTGASTGTTSTDTKVDATGESKKGVDVGVQTTIKEEEEEEEDKAKRRLSSPACLPSGMLQMTFVPTTEEAKVLLKMIEQLREQLQEEQRSRKTLEEAMTKKERQKNVKL